MTKENPTDPRASAVIAHFNEWHGASPDQIEVAALLKRIDAADPIRLISPLLKRLNAQQRNGPKNG